MADQDGDSRRELAAERKAIREGRQQFASTDGPFVRAMQGAMTEYLAFRKAGATREDAERGIEAVLRDVWPFKATHFPPACDTCTDTGFRELMCWDGHRCGRKVCAVGHPSFEHRYVVPCECPAGDRHRKQILETDDHLAAIGRRRKKPKGLTRIGS